MSHIEDLKKAHQEGMTNMAERGSDAAITMVAQSSHATTKHLETAMLRGYEHWGSALAARRYIERGLAQKHKDYIENFNHEVVNYSYARHGVSDPDHIRQLYKRQADKRLTGRAGYSSGLSMNPYTPPDVLSHIAVKSPEVSTRDNVVDHKNTTPETLKFMAAHDRSSTIRINAENKLYDVHGITMTAEDRHPDSAMNFLKNLPEL